MVSEAKLQLVRELLQLAERKIVDIKAALRGKKLE